MARVERSWSRQPLSSAPVVPGRLAYWREPRASAPCEGAVAGADMSEFASSHTDATDLGDRAGDGVLATVPQAVRS